MGQAGSEVWVTVDGEKFQVKVEDLNQRPVIAYVEGKRFEVEIRAETASEEAQNSPEMGQPSSHSIPAGTSCEVTAPMPGDIVKIHVLAGQNVKAGDPLCVLDAMKMKNTIHAPQDGTIAAVAVSEGQSVEFGVPLFSLG